MLFISFLSYAKNISNPDLESLYKKYDISKEISFSVFKKAYLLEKKSDNKSNIMTIIDYGKKSTIKRMVIIDKERETLLLKTFVSHGKKSGQLYAREFSNVTGSNKTSLGIYRASETYHGKYGYSLKLDGLSDTNSKARERYIVLHGARYATQSWLDKYGVLGRSLGCPSVPPEISKLVIDLIRDGSYIYAFV